MGQTYSVFAQRMGQLVYLGEAFGYSSEEALENAKKRFKFRTSRPVINAFPTKHK